MVKLIDSFPDTDLWKGNGRPPLTLKDMLKCLIIMDKFKIGSRRAISVIALLKNQLKISQIPSFNSLLNYRKKPEIVEMLKQLIHATHRSISDYDKSLITDSTGKSTSRKKIWQDWKMKKRKKKDFVKSHYTFTKKTLMIAEASVTQSKGAGTGDPTQMEEHAHSIRNRQIDADFWYADGAYCSRECANAAVSVGAEPVFRVKSNASTKKKGSAAFRDMVKESREHPRRYKKKYNSRAKCEAGMHSIKSKHSDRIFSRAIKTQESEILSEAVAYNISRISNVVFEFGITPNFSYSSQV
jgi:transposase